MPSMGQAESWREKGWFSGCGYYELIVAEYSVNVVGDGLIVGAWGLKSDVTGPQNSVEVVLNVAGQRHSVGNACG